jgi:coenzyme F420-reducing hydrogenase delta subunit
MTPIEPIDTAVEPVLKRPFKPRIVLFQCRFNHYSTADLEQIETLDTANVKCIQVPCAGRISPLFILSAVQGGADAIVVSGCRPGGCHFKQGNLGARRQLAAFHDLLAHVGMAAERLDFIWMDPTDRGRLIRVMNALIATVRLLGPARSLVTRSTVRPEMKVN